MNKRFGVVLAVVVALVVAFAMFLQTGEMRAVGFTYETLSFEEAGFDSFDEYVNATAAEVSLDVCGRSNDEKAQLQREMMELYDAADGYDIVLILNPGGWGNTSIEEAKREWGTIVGGIETWMSDMDHKYVVVEHRRCDSNVPDILRELRNFLTSQYPESEKLAAKVHFLTRVYPDVDVLLVGQSSGAMFTTDVMLLLESNPRVFSIQGGRPFWDKSPNLPRTLIMDSNGKDTDTLTTGNIGDALSYNFVRLVSRLRPGNFALLDGEFRAPGHQYAWEYPEVRQLVHEFLERNFGS